MSDNVEIYSAEVCPFAQRTLMLLYEKNINHTLTEINLKNKPTNFTEISPHGKVPVIRHNQHHIYESIVINEYLEDVFPTPKCSPMILIKKR